MTVRDQLQRSARNLLADGVEGTGEWLLQGMAQRIGCPNLAGLDLLDVGCGAQFTQTLINRQLPFESYTGIEVNSLIVDWLKKHVEARDERFTFVFWNVRNAMYNRDGRPPERSGTVAGRWSL